MKTFWSAAILAGITGLSWAANEPAPLSKNINYATYAETVDNVTVLVYSDLALKHESEQYFPLVLAVGVRDREPLTFVRESVTLRDEGSHIYYPPSYDDFIKTYRHRASDMEMLKQKPLDPGKTFARMDKKYAAFYPLQGGIEKGLGKLTLPKKTWWTDTIYFPHPAEGLDGVLTLSIMAQGLSEAVNVRFKIPQRGKTSKNKNQAEEANKE